MTDFMDTTSQDPTRRDRYGRYLVLPPDGTKPIGYTRATTIAKTLDDNSALMAWAERMVAVGLSQRPDLLAQVHEAGDDRRALGQICNKAKEQGGATIRRDLGTSLHRILERHWTEPGYQPPAAHIDDVAAVDRALTQAQMTVDPSYCETLVVSDRHQLAGTFDLLVQTPEGLAIADIKTGRSVDYGAVGFAIQLTIYATADAIYQQGTDPTGQMDLRWPMPAVAQDHAYIIHVEPGSGRCTIHRLTLDPELLDLALTVRQIRRRRDLLTIHKPAAIDDSDLRAEIARWAETDREQLAAHWPATIPTPKHHPDPYPVDLQEQIREALRRLRTTVGASWHPDDRTIQPEPTETPPKATEQPASPTKMPAEGPNAEKQAKAVLDGYRTLDRTGQTWIDTVAKQARTALLPISIDQKRSTRRVAIGQILVHAAQNGWDEQDLHDIYDSHIDSDLTGLDIPLGVKLGAMDYRQAKTMAAIATLGRQITQDPNTTKEP